MAGITGMPTASGGVVVPFSADGARYNAGIDSMEGKTRSLEATLKSVGGAISSVGMEAMKLGGLIAAPLAEAAREALKFQDEFAKVNSLIPEAAEAALTGLRDGIKRVSKEIGEDLSTLTRGVYQALSAGVPKEDTIRFVELAAKTAVAGVSDTFTAVDALTTAVNAYGKQLDQYGDYTGRAAHIADIMFQTVKDGKIEFTQLASTLGNVASTAASANVSFEELGAAYATLTLRGIGPEEATTAINAAILGLISPSKDASEALDALRIQWKEFRNGAVTFSEIVNQIASKTGQHATAVISSLFSERRALKSMVALTAEDAQQYNSELNSMTNATGEMDKALTIMSATVQHRIKQALADFHVQMVDIGNVLLPMITEKLRSVNDLLQRVSEYTKSNPEAVARVVTGAAGAAGGLLAFGGASFVIGRVIKDLALLVTAAKWAGPIIASIGTAINTAFTVVAARAIVPVLGELGLKFSALGGVVEGISTSLLSFGVTGVIGVALAGFAALMGGAVYANTGSVSETLHVMWNVLKQIGSWTGDAVIAALKTIWSVAKTVGGVFADILSYIPGIDKLVDVFSKAGKILVDYSKAKDQLAESEKRLSKAESEAIDRLLTRGKITNEQAKAIRSLGTEEERRAAILKAISDANAAVQATQQAQAAAEIQMITGQAATEQQIETARQTMLEKSVSARTAAMYATKLITDQQLDGITKVSDAEKKSYDERTRIFFEFNDEKNVINSKDLSQQKALMDSLGIKTQSELQQTAIINTARQYSLDLQTAAFVVQHNLTAEQIRMVQQGAMAEVFATQTKKEARKQDTDDQAASMIQTVTNWNTYLDLLDTAYAEMAAKEKELQAKVKEQIATQGYAERGTVEALLEAHRAMRDMAEASADVQEKVAPRIINALAEQAGMAQEVANATVDANERTKISDEGLAASGQLVLQTILTGSQQYTQAYSKLTDDQNTALQIALGALVQSLASTDEITAAFPTLLKRVVELHPEVAETDAQRVVKTIQDAATGVDAATAPVHDVYNQRFALSHSESPSVLDILQNDIGVMSGMYETLTNVVGSATNTIYGMWVDLSNWLQPIFNDMYNAMQYLNPWATHSPSLVDSVDTGASAIEDRWSTTVEHLRRAYKSLYDQLQAWLQDYVISGGSLTNILDNPVYKKMLADLEKVGGMLEFAVAREPQEPAATDNYTPTAQASTPPDAVGASGSADSGGVRVSSYRITAAERSGALQLPQRTIGGGHKQPIYGSDVEVRSSRTPTIYDRGHMERKLDSDVLRLLQVSNLYNTVPGHYVAPAELPKTPVHAPRRVSWAPLSNAPVADPTKWWHVTTPPPTGDTIDAVGSRLLQLVRTSGRPRGSPGEYAAPGPGASPIINTMSVNIGQVRSDTQIRVLAQAHAAEAEMLSWRRRRS